MSIGRSLEGELREIGRASAEAVASSRPAPSRTRELMRVTAVRGGVVDLDRGSEASPMPVLGVPVTSGCAGVRAGDVAVVDTLGHKPIAIGVMGAPRPGTAHTQTLSGAVGTPNQWVRLGTWRKSFDAAVAVVDVLSGDGYNGNPSQNRALRLFIKDAWQSSHSTSKAFGATAEIWNGAWDDYDARVIALARDECEVWVKFSKGHWNGAVDVRCPGEWAADGRTVRADAPTGAAQSIEWLVASAPLRFASGHYGLSCPDPGARGGWIRTTESGLLPFSDGTGALGTESFRFSHVWGKAVHADRIDRPTRILWSGPGYYMHASHEVALSETVSSQATGIVLHWQEYDGGTKNYGHSYQLVPKRHVQAHAGEGVTHFITNSSGNTVGTKYVYVSDSKIVGNDHNKRGKTAMDSGISVTPNRWVLTEVLGV